MIVFITASLPLDTGSRNVRFPPIADIRAKRHKPLVRNIQIIDGALNATFSVFQATDEEFAAIFPDGRDMEVIEDFVTRAGDQQAEDVLASLWDRPILKRDAQGIHGTLFYGYTERREYLPATKREVDWDEHHINDAQRQLFGLRR